jgi:uncharacterized protein (TIGR00251 family)
LNNHNHTNNHWLLLKVSPNASRNEITGLRDGVLQVKITAAPEGGKANRELITFLSRTLKVKKSAISIIRGETRRHKVISIEGMSREDIISKIGL